MAFRCSLTWKEFGKQNASKLIWVLLQIFLSQPKKNKGNTGCI
jgi:hypothetical protein